MSKMIEVSDHDYARIQDAADAAGMPLDTWVIENLPLEGPAPVQKGEVPPGPDGKPAKSMYDLFAGRVGVVNSGGAERLSERHSEVFGEILEEKRRAGHL
jgi:hypothetical protein